MKVVWTFILITFIVTLVLSLGGIDVDSGASVNVLGQVFNVSTIAVLNSIFNGDFLSGSVIAFIIIIIGAMTATAAINAFTGGNASVAITVAYGAFTAYCISLLFSFIHLISYTKGLANCSGLLKSCGDVGVIIVYFYGVILLVGFAFALVDLVGGND